MVGSVISRKEEDIFGFLRSPLHLPTVELLKGKRMDCKGFNLQDKGLSFINDLKKPYLLITRSQGRVIDGKEK